MWRFRADGVAGFRVAEQRHRLTAATAEIDRLALARATRLLHPIKAAERLKRGRLRPNIGERFFARAPEHEAGNDLGGMAGQYLAARANIHRLPAPAAHASLRVARVIIGRDMVDDHRAPILLAPRLDGGVG